MPKQTSYNIQLKTPKGIKIVN